MQRQKNNQGQYGPRALGFKNELTIVANRNNEVKNRNQKWEYTKPESDARQLK